MGQENVSREFKDYSHKMAKIVKEHHYNNPWMDDNVNPIPMPRNIVKETGKGLTHSVTKFELLDTPHGAICDDPLCQAFFNISDDGVHALYYTELPVYTRLWVFERSLETGELRKLPNLELPIQLCAVCIGV